MPCHDPQPAYYAEASKRRLDDLTDMLCRTCRIMETQGALQLLHEDVLDWWKKHKKADEARVQREERQKQLDRERKLRQFNTLKEELGL